MAAPAATSLAGVSHLGSRSLVGASTRARSGTPLLVARPKLFATNRRSRGSVGVFATSAPAKPVSKFSPQTRVEVLSEALPYLQKFRGKTIVIKYGGAAMKDPSLKAGVVADIVLLACVGIRPVLVHGGGPEINSWLAKVGIEPNFKNGLRVTDGPTMDLVEMVLVGRVNKSIVSLINEAGGRAVGICGKDGNTIMARQMIEKDIGFVGEVTGVNPTLLKTLVDADSIPVVATVASGYGGQALNINADTAAGEIAAALQAEKLILMTDVPGVMRDKDVPSSLFRSLDIRSCKELVGEGVIYGGMTPKVDCCIRSLAQGVSAAHIIDGRQSHSLLQELLTDEGVGTMITG
eukprot:CAMPEP_0177766310 /NCGR_PEP_ID=MMETSP0491_2-20121128/8459_1 /TAXON_ID=63592 /ORGANISM="Tetraselmis chuii, Strain PLY429" /LENGTH=348 /DNA_ID=CAMNT_0019282721 /DNA_START=48 /DNA_END=1094 /DNA_ORIENTATION=+